MYKYLSTCHMEYTLATNFVTSPYFGTTRLMMTMITTFSQSFSKYAHPRRRRDLERVISGLGKEVVDRSHNCPSRQRTGIFEKEAS
mmetsp:Transcript_4209/g.6361  ORF Transcript_4209/g.6361 Transcript_4209/m.6361 type:complete len:86 (-) Transcript_4209:317-574(-)